MKTCKRGHEHNERQCPECRREVNRKYREANKERRREVNRKYREANKERSREYRKANPEASRESVRKYREANKGRIAEYQREYREANRELGRLRHVRRSYGLSVDRAATMIYGACEICGKSYAATGKVLHVDHDHACCLGERSCGGCVRGSLCGSCNRMLGLAGDSVSTLARAIGYLAKYARGVVE